MKFALVMTGGILKGSFQAGVIKAFAEQDLKPAVVVGASAGALNAGMVTKLVTEGNFTAEAVQNNIIKDWMNETTSLKLWGKGDVSKNDTIRNIFGDIHTNPFMLIRRLAHLQLDMWYRLKTLMSLSFISIFNNDNMMDILTRNISTPDEIKEDIICAISITDLLAHSEYIRGQAINNYNQFVTFDFKKGDNKGVKEKFKKLIDTAAASATLPGMFPPFELDIKDDGNKKFYVDGGITKNAPFGRAIKLNPEIENIFLVTTSPITKPITNKVENFSSILGQVYEIMVTKDIVNDYRKVVQINERIRLLQKVIERDENNVVIDNEKNNDLCKLAGFKHVTDFVSKRCVNIIFVEPTKALEGDPFAAFYRKDRRYLLDMYIKHGYEVGKKVLKEFSEKNKTELEKDTVLSN